MANTDEIEGASSRERAGPFVVRLSLPYDFVVAFLNSPRPINPAPSKVRVAGSGTRVKGSHFIVAPQL